MIVDRRSKKWAKLQSCVIECVKHILKQETNTNKRKDTFLNTIILWIIGDYWWLNHCRNYGMIAYYIFLQICFSWRRLRPGKSMGKLVIMVNLFSFMWCWNSISLERMQWKAMHWWRLSSFTLFHAVLSRYWFYAKTRQFQSMLVWKLLKPKCFWQASAQRVKLFRKH